MRARLGLVTPAVGEAAVQRGALQDQQPSGGRWKSAQQPSGRQDRSRLEDGGSRDGSLLEEAGSEDGCVAMAALALVLLLITASEWPAQTYKNAIQKFR